MKRLLLLLAMLACSSVLAELDYKQLVATKRDQPAVATTTEGVTISIPYGALEVPKGAIVKIMAIKADGVLEVEYNAQKFSIPAGKTDLEKRVADIRNRRIVIDGVEYEDFKFSEPTVIDVTITHRKGVGKVPLVKLPPELQKQFGYDPQKVAAYEQAQEEANRRTEWVRKNVQNISGKVNDVIEGKGVILSNELNVNAYLQAGGTDPRMTGLSFGFLECDTPKLVNGSIVRCSAYREGTYTYTTVTGGNRKINRWVYYGPTDDTKHGTLFNY